MTIAQLKVNKINLDVISTCYFCLTSLLKQPALKIVF